MCAVGSDDALLNKLCGVTKRILALRHEKRSQMTIFGILYMRKGELLISLSSDNDYGRNKVVSHNISKTRANQNKRSTSVLHQVVGHRDRRESIHSSGPTVSGARNRIKWSSDYRRGDHVWCVNVVHEPPHRQSFALHRGFLVEWLLFTLDGQPRYASQTNNFSKLTYCQGRLARTLGRTKRRPSLLWRRDFASFIPGQHGHRYNRENRGRWRLVSRRCTEVRS